VAANKGEEFLHEALALGAFQILRDPPSGDRELEAAARMSISHKLVMVSFERGRKPIKFHTILPLVELHHGGHHGSEMAVDDDLRSPAEHGPASALVVAKKLTYLLHHLVVYYKKIHF